MRMLALLCVAVPLATCKSPQSDGVVEVTVLRQKKATAQSVKLTLRETSPQSKSPPVLPDTCTAFKEAADGGPSTVLFQVRKSGWESPRVKAEAFEDALCQTALTAEDSQELALIFPTNGTAGALTLEVGPDRPLDKVDEDRDAFYTNNGELTDCDDSDPKTYPGAPENCGDAKDNSCNGLVDCADPFCQNKPSSGELPTCNGEGSFCKQQVSGVWFCFSNQEICGDGIDNNENGKTDCFEPSCQGKTCDDKQVCTNKTVCLADGGCGAGEAVMCPPPANACEKQATCLESVVGGCAPAYQPSGTGCAGNVCQNAGTCNGSGTCNNAPKCVAQGDCQNAPCDANSGVCSSEPKADLSDCKSATSGKCLAGKCEAPLVPSLTLPDEADPMNSKFAGKGKTLTIPAGCTVSLLTNGTGKPSVASVSPSGCVSIPETLLIGNSSHAFLVADSSVVNGTLILQGVRPFSMIAATTLTVSETGTVNAATSTGMFGPAGQNTPLYCTRSDGSNDTKTSGGGTGGSYVNLGGRGGAAMSTNKNVGSATSSSGSANAFTGGCPGGQGGNARVAGAVGFGGFGGGAFQLYAGDKISIAGKLFAMGLGGKGGNTTTFIGGGGGGSGGTIELEARVIELLGPARLNAVGGGGGAGNDYAVSGDGQTSDGTTAAAAAGGTTADVTSSNGGAGSTQRSNAGLGGSNAMSTGDVATAGGGGGGVGRIIIRTFSFAPAAGALVVPAACRYQASNTLPFGLGCPP